MRDIGSRIKRYRLSRYAAPDDHVRRRLRWVWVLAGLWLVWIGLVSDHSLWRIWRQRHDNARIIQQAAIARVELADVDRNLHDPRAARAYEEYELRVKFGMIRPGERVYRVRDDAPDSLSR